MRLARVQVLEGENQGEERQRGEKHPPYTIHHTSAVDCILCQSPRPLVLIIVLIIPCMWRHSL